MTSSAELYSRSRASARCLPVAQLGQHGQDGVVLPAVDGAMALLFGDQDLVHLLARADAGDLGLDRSGSPIRLSAMSTTRADGTRGM